MKSFTHVKLNVMVCENDEALAARAASDFAAEVRRLLEDRESLNVIFAGAESQMKFHQALVAREDIPWQKLHAIAVDEFWAPHIPRECSVCEQPRRDLYQHVPLAKVSMLDFAAEDPEAERARYERIVRDHPPHVACLGIGVSGHLAFNEPGDAVFDEHQPVKLVDVCEQSKRQLMSDPNFKGLGTIPEKGITITIPTLLTADSIFCLAPYRIKAEIIRDMFSAGITTHLPATVLKTHPNTRLYLDEESYSLCQ
jgi:glucosamine-6-phosphate deaminase